MPRSRQIPSLVNLCIGNIAENVVSHSLAMQRCGHDEQLQFLYHSFQFHFGGRLLDRLRSMHTVIRSGSFVERRCFSDILSICSDFILNKYMKKVAVHSLICVKRQGSEALTSSIIARCKEVEDMDLHFSQLNEVRLLELISHWKNILKLDLSLTSCTDRIVCAIWEHLPNLQELYLYETLEISDRCLLYLCKRHPGDSGDNFCEEMGLCCSLGEKLKILDVRGTNITEMAIKCALLHLRSLEILDYNGDENCTSFENIVSFMLLELEEEISLKETSINLKLKSVICDKELNPDQLRTIMSFCPYLKHLELWVSAKTLDGLTQNFIVSVRSLYIHFFEETVVDSTQLPDFLKKWGGQLEKLTVCVESGSLEIRHVVSILKLCKELKELQITGSFLNDTGFIDNLDRYEVCNSLENLQVFKLNRAYGCNKDQALVLVEILKSMRNLKIVELSSGFGWFVLPHLSEIITLQNLEEIHFTQVNIDRVSFIPMLGTQYNLKKIILTDCTNIGTFIDMYTDITRKNNTPVHIECRKKHRYSERKTLDSYDGVLRARRSYYNCDTFQVCILNLNKM